MRKLINRRRLQEGFTIVELMIATTVLSVILVLVTGVMISIGNLYYKGVNQARVQDGTRSIIDDVTQRLQLNDRVPTSGSAVYSGQTIKSYCVGSTHYSYITGVKIGDVPRDASNNPVSGVVTINHILWRNNGPVDSCVPQNIILSNPGGTDGTELVPDGSQLDYFSIVPTSPYSVTVALAFGDNDLQENWLASNPNPACKGIKGDQFCATAVLSVRTVKRLADN